MTYADRISPDHGLIWPGFEKKDYAGVRNSEIQGDLELKRKIEEAAHEDPIKFGWILESWKEIHDSWATYKTHVVLGGNRSSKTKMGSRLVVDILEKIPECRIRAYQVNSDKSIAEQQEYVWDALPQKYKALAGQRNKAYNIQYSQANGFTNNKLILPPQEGYKRGSEIIFGNYQQYRNDPQIVEGWWAHLIWCDEEVPQKMFERLLTRLYDARGRLLLTFTTIEGWSPLIADILGRTRTLKRRYSDLLGRQLPIAQESLTRKNTRVYYFWTQDNPFIPPDTIEAMRGRPEAEVLAVAHGIPTRSATTKFPKFNEEVHVIKHENLPWERAVRLGEDLPEVTRYHIIDPAGSKPWFMLWAAVDAAERVFIYTEWPDQGYGSWGEPSDKPEGQPGPAQKPNGFGIKDYLEKIEQCQGEDEIFEHLIDPRMGAALTQGQEDATSIISELEDAGMVIQPAPGQLIDHGISLINDRLSYDETKPIGPTNSPRLFISDRCANLIECFKNYTGCARQEVWKDPIDCVRYLLEAGADFVANQNQQVQGSTFSYGGSPGS